MTMTEYSIMTVATIGESFWLHSFANTNTVRSGAKQPPTYRNLFAQIAISILSADASIYRPIQLIVTTILKSTSNVSTFLFLSKMLPAILKASKNTIK